MPLIEQRLLRIHHQDKTKKVALSTGYIVHTLPSPPLPPVAAAALEASNTEKKKER
jgi:hypothetical protein